MCSSESIGADWIDWGTKFCAVQEEAGGGGGNEGSEFRGGEEREWEFEGLDQ